MHVYIYLHRLMYTYIYVSANCALRWPNSVYLKRSGVLPMGNTNIVNKYVREISGLLFKRAVFLWCCFAEEF